MSRAVSARYPTGCGFCGAACGEPCRSLTTGRVTDTHADRIVSAAGEWNAAHTTEEQR